MKSTAVDESLSSMNQQFCSRENQLLQKMNVLLHELLWHESDFPLYYLE